MSLHRSSLDWLLSTQGRGIQPGLQRMEHLLASLGHPEKELRCLHVAGTNGKGSVCAFAESVLRAAGYRTGLYTSPHLVDFSERIRINGEPVDEMLLEAGIRRIQEVTRDWSEAEWPTFFEMVTALAFDLFARAQCDIIILETGLGGRLDATNTAPKIACAITPIALDHTEWLGETLTEIAREKAGILRANRPAVIAPQETEAAEALAAEGAKIGAPVTWIREALPKSLRLGLAGSHQRWNAALALALLRAGGFSPSEEEIRKGMADVSWPGRFQRLLSAKRGRKLVLDGAHNLHAARSLVATWREEYGDQKCRVIFGALSDKHPESLLTVLEELASEIFLVPVASPRSVNPAELLVRLSPPHSVPYRVCGSLSEALDKAFVDASLDSMPPDERERGQPPHRNPPVLLAGSLFLVGEALALESGGRMLSRSQ